MKSSMKKTNTFIIKSVDRLFEISVVDFPAYDTTSISARSEIETIEANRQAVLKQQKQKNHFKNFILKKERGTT